jgi:hypothetical protein
MPHDYIPQLPMLSSGLPDATAAANSYRDAMITTRQSVQIANQIAHDRSKDAPIRALGSSIIGDLTHAKSEIPMRIALWIRENVKYTQETPLTEVLQGPYRTLGGNISVVTPMGPFKFNGTGTGDCDDLSILFAALCRSVGIEGFLAGIAKSGSPDNFFHAMGYCNGLFYELSKDAPYGGLGGKEVASPAPYNNITCLIYDPARRDFKRLDPKRPAGLSMSSSFNMQGSLAQGLSGSSECSCGAMSGPNCSCQSGMGMTPKEFAERPLNSVAFCGEPVDSLQPRYTVPLNLYAPSRQISGISMNGSDSLSGSLPAIGVGAPISMNGAMGSGEGIGGPLLSVTGASAHFRPPTPHAIDGSAHHFGRGMATTIESPAPAVDPYIRLSVASVVPTTVRVQKLGGTSNRVLEDKKITLPGLYRPFTADQGVDLIGLTKAGARGLFSRTLTKYDRDAYFYYKIDFLRPDGTYKGLNLRWNDLYYGGHVVVLLTPSGKVSRFNGEAGVNQHLSYPERFAGYPVPAPGAPPVKYKPVEPSKKKVYYATIAEIPGMSAGAIAYDATGRILLRVTQLYKLYQTLLTSGKIKPVITDLVATPTGDYYIYFDGISHKKIEGNFFIAALSGAPVTYDSALEAKYGAMSPDLKKWNPTDAARIEQDMKEWEALSKGTIPANPAWAGYKNSALAYIILGALNEMAASSYPDLYTRVGQPSVYGNDTPPPPPPPPVVETPPVVTPPPPPVVTQEPAPREEKKGGVGLLGLAAAAAGVYFLSTRG